MQDTKNDEELKPLFLSLNPGDQVPANQETLQIDCNNGGNATTPNLKQYFSPSIQGICYIIITACLIIGWIANAPTEFFIVVVAIGIALCCLDSKSPPCLSIFVISFTTILLLIILLKPLELELVHVHSLNDTTTNSSSFLFFFQNVPTN